MGLEENDHGLINMQLG